MYYCEIHNNVLRERERMYVDMLFKQGEKWLGVKQGGGLSPYIRGGFHDLKVPAQLPVPLKRT